MTKCLRIMGLCVSLSVFVALLALLTPLAVTDASAGVCPCNYEAVPKTAECWTDNCQFLTFTTDITIPPSPDQYCTLFSFSCLAPYTELYVTVGSPVAPPSCHMVLPPSCGTPTAISSLTQEELEACQCELQAYATALNDAGISVPTGPPYQCSTPPLECAQPPSIPTLNQWGMIIMVGVLGLFAVIGLFIMRTRNEVKPSN